MCRHSLVYRLLFLPLAVSLLAAAPASRSETADTRLRLIIETDAGGDPDDEQSLVRFLVYANCWDIEGIIANRPDARDGENLNTERSGLAITRRLVRAYGECWPNLVKHAPNFPPVEQLQRVTVAGYNETDAAENLIVAAVDRDDSRPVWYSDWGTDVGSSKNNLRRALDRVLKERGPEGYAGFKSRLRLASAEAFGEHTEKIEPPFALWVDTFRPELERKRWYHRFSALTATAGGFDIERDVRRDHGPLGALYPLNTTHRQKEGDSMTFLYLVPTGMNEPMQPTWGSWAGRYALNPEAAPRPYYWATARDEWHGTTSRENTLARWAVAMQHDFAARMDWCVTSEYAKANHPPVAVLNHDRTRQILQLSAKPGEQVELTSAGSSDPDGQAFATHWYVYREAGTFDGPVALSQQQGEASSFTAPQVTQPATLHVVLELEDTGTPSLFAYRRAVITIRP